MQEPRTNKKTLILVVLFLMPIFFVPQSFASGTTQVNTFAGGASSITVVSDGNNTSTDLQIDLERNVTFQDASFVVEGQSAAARHLFHTVEQWRDRLTADGQALTQFIDEFPNVERQQLRQLVGAAGKHAPAGGQEASDAHRHAQRILFKFVRATLAAHGDEQLTPGAP